MAYDNDIYPGPPRGEGGPGSDRPEEIIGQIPVVAELALGIENLRIVLTTRRIIVAHMKKKGVGALASVPFLGKFALDKLEKERSGHAATQKSTHLAASQILAADKDNFQFDYDDIVTAEAHRSRMGLKIIILTRDDKFQFTTGQDPRLVENLLRRAFGTKLAVRTLR